MNRESLEIVVVIEPVGALRPGSRLEQPELFVVADRARRQAEGRRNLLDSEERPGGLAGGCGVG